MKKIAKNGDAPERGFDYRFGVSGVRRSEAGEVGETKEPVCIGAMVDNDERGFGRINGGAVGFKGDGRPCFEEEGGDQEEGTGDLGGKIAVIGEGEGAEEEVGERLEKAGSTCGADDKGENEENWEKGWHSSDRARGGGGGGGVGKG